MFYQTSMGLIYLIFNQLPFLWDTSVGVSKKICALSAQILRNKKQRFDPAYGLFINPMGIFEDMHKSYKLERL